MNKIFQNICLCCVILIVACSSPNSKKTDIDTTKKATKINSSFGEYAYSNNYFGYSFKSNVLFDSEIARTDSLCEYYDPLNESNMIDVFIWHDTEYLHQSDNITDISETVLTENGLEHFRILETTNDEIPTILCKVYKEDYRTNITPENHAFFHLTAWNKKNHSIYDISFISDVKNQDEYKSMARSFRFK